MLTIEEKEHLANKHYGLVDFMAYKYSNKGVDKEDLISVGNEAFANALNKFDKTKNVKFTTYVYYILEYKMKNALRKPKKTYSLISFDREMIPDTDLNMSNLICNKISLEDEVIMKDDIEKAYSILDGFSTFHKKIIYDTIFLGYRASDVCKKYGITQNAVSYVLNKFRKKISFLIKK